MELDELQRRMGYTFSNQALLKSVLIRKAANLEKFYHFAVPVEQPIGVAAANFEALKFLGSKLIALILADALYHVNAEAEEGVLTQSLSNLLDLEAGLSQAAQTISLGEALVIGQGEELQNVRSNAKILGAHFEALIAAIWLDASCDLKIVKHRLWHAYRLDETLLTNSIKPVNLAQVYFYPMQPTARIVEQRLGYSFRQGHLLEQALTRQSSLNENPRPTKKSFQRLEFLGDRVLGCVIAYLLLERYPQETKGRLTHLFHSYTHNTGPLANVAKQLKLQQALNLGYGEEGLNLRNDTKALSDHMEALIGALWLDSQKDFRLLKTKLAALWQMNGLQAMELPELNASQILADKNTAVVEEIASKQSLKCPAKQEAFPMPFWQKNSALNEATTITLSGFQEALLAEKSKNKAKPEKAINKPKVNSSKQREAFLVLATVNNQTKSIASPSLSGYSQALLSQSLKKNTKPQQLSTHYQQEYPALKAKHSKPRPGL
ncbi:MAG: ribonuclease [Gammaproteobacteria bacterium]|nr:ribonuclease [Gammaproteobacteria bacterium]